MSFMLILTMIFSITAQASTPIQIKPVQICFDTENATTYDLEYSDAKYKMMVDGIFGGQINTSSSRTVLSSFEGYTNVLRVSRASGKYPFIQFYIRNENNESIEPSDGMVVYKAKIYTTEELTSDKRHFRIYPKRGSSGAKAQKLYDDTDAYKWVPNVWYDVTWTINMDSSSDNVSLVMVPELSASSSSEVSTRTISHEYSYTEEDINYLRIDLGTQNHSGQYIYFANIKTTYYPDITYNKAEILEIGSSGEVAYEQNNIRVKLSDEIPGLKLEHISIKNAGDQDIAISSAAVSSDGTYYYLDVVATSPLPAWTNYNLEISADAWGNGSLQNDGISDSPVTAIDENFYTPSAPFDMKEPTFSVSGGNLNASTTIINTTGTPENITLALVIYDADGRIKSVTPTSYDNFEAAYPGTDKTVIGGNFAEGDTAKLIAINGWDNPIALFGKYWETSYDELN